MGGSLLRLSNKKALGEPFQAQTTLRVPKQKIANPPAAIYLQNRTSFVQVAF
jgi:hypothetical protein